jgi:hypothetical protein
MDRKPTKTSEKKTSFKEEGDGAPRRPSQEEEAAWEVVEDSSAGPGEMVQALARLLLQIVERK